MSAPFSLELIEHSRQVNNVPADWEYKMCEADCGELVWCPPGVIATGAKVVCSATCIAGLLARGS